MKWIGWFLAIFLSLALIFCIYFPGEDKQDLLYQKVIFDTENYEYKIKVGPNHIIKVGVKENGNLNYFVNFPKSHEQIISFHDNGIIKSKIKVDRENKTQDRAYYFYENSGNLSSSYNYVNDVKVGSAISYHDSSDHIKEIMLYNDFGELYSRKTYDWQGNLIKTEGSREGEKN